MPKVQTATGYNTTASTSVPTQTPFTADPTPGNLLVLRTGGGAAFPTPTGYTPATSDFSDFAHARIFYKIAEGDEGKSPTFTIASAAPASWSLEEWSGVKASPLDKAAGLNTAFPGAGKTASCGTTDPTSEAGEVAFALMVSYGAPAAIDSGGVASFSNSFTGLRNVLSTNPTDANIYVSTAEKVITPAAAVETSATFPFETQHVTGCIATFRFDATAALAVTASVDKASLYTGQTAHLTSEATGGSGDKTPTWSVISGPSTASSQLSSTSSATPSFTPAGGVGTYQVKVVYSDASGAAQAIVTISVIAPSTSNPAYLSRLNLGDWTNEGGAASAEVALSDSSDTTYLRSPDNPSSEDLVGELHLAKPSGASDDITVTLRLRANDAATASVTVKLMEGDTQRGTTKTIDDLTTTAANYSVTFSSSEWSPIAASSWGTDQVRLLIEATATASA